MGEVLALRAHIGRERRGAPRIDFQDDLEGSLEVSVRVLDVSLSGLSLETSFPLHRGATHRIRLSHRDGSAAIVEATVVHCEARLMSEDGPRYVSGLTFSGDPTARSLAMGFLLDKVADEATADLA
jgi:hypothetical protein